MKTILRYYERKTGVIMLKTCIFSLKGGLKLPFVVKGVTKAESKADATKYRNIFTVTCDE